MGDLYVIKAVNKNRENFIRFYCKLFMNDHLVYIKSAMNSLMVVSLSFVLNSMSLCCAMACRLDRLGQI